MIAVTGSNPMGNVLHLIMGPESDLIADIHGAIIMDITDAIASFNKDSRTFVSISKCRNEIMTSNMMNSAGVKYMGSLAQSSQAKEKETESASSAPVQSNEGITVALKDGVCEYCGNKTRLMPIPGTKICMPCAQIELGLKKGRKHAKTTSDI